MRRRKAERRLAVERSRADDLDEAGGIGELFALGDVENVVRYAELTFLGGAGNVVCVLAFAAGLPASLVIPFDSSLALAIRIGVLAGCVALFLLGSWFAESYRETGGRMCLYSGGMAQLSPESQSRGCCAGPTWRASCLPPEPTVTTSPHLS